MDSATGCGRVGFSFSVERKSSFSGFGSTPSNVRRSRVGAFGALAALPRRSSETGRRRSARASLDPSAGRAWLQSIEFPPILQPIGVDCLRFASWSRMADKLIALHLICLAWHRIHIRLIVLSSRRESLD